MSAHYSDPARANDPHALPDIETFHIKSSDAGEQFCFACELGFELSAELGDFDHEDHIGWYWRACFPGCLPDSESVGPFATEAEAVADAQSGNEPDPAAEFLADFRRETAGLSNVNVGFASCCTECVDVHGFRDEENADGGEVVRTAEEIAETAWESGNVADEPGFSWESCDTCGSSLGGNRSAGHGFDNKQRVVHLSMCTDCVMFVANGDLPTLSTDGAE